MTFRERFEHLSALQKFIRRGYAQSAKLAARKLSADSMMRDRLYVIMFEDIGLANVNLLKRSIAILRPTEQEFNKIIEEMANSTKSRLCSYLTYIFRDAFIYESSSLDSCQEKSEKYEPTPDKQAKIFGFSAEDYSLLDSIKLIGAMFMKGMDYHFWELVQDELVEDDDLQFALNLERVANIMAIQGGRSVPMVWIFALLWKYQRSLEIGFPEKYVPLPDCEKLIDISVSKQKESYPDWVYDKHTAKGKQLGRDEEHFFNEGIKVNALEPLDIPALEDETYFQKYCLQYKKEKKEPEKLKRSNAACQSSRYFTLALSYQSAKIKMMDLGLELPDAKYSFEEVVNYSSARSKKILSLSELGGLQTPYINKIGKRPYVLYCWLKPTVDSTEKCRYVLKPFNTKQNAMLTVEADKMMHNSKSAYCNPSSIICLAEIIEKIPLLLTGGQVILKKHYYTISKALPYFYPVTVALDEWKSSSIADDVIHINLLKYIFGIQDRTARNCGVYIVQTSEKRSLRVCSFDHGTSTTDTKESMIGKLGKVDLSLLEPFKKWLSKKLPSLDKKYYTRACEVITAI